MAAAAAIVKVTWYEGEEEPEDERQEEPSCECQYCCCSFFGEEYENYCSTQCAARGAGMEKDPHTGIETLRECEKEPADLAPGKSYKEEVHQEDDSRDLQFFSKVVVQKDGTLKQVRGSIHLRNKTFKNWRAWRMFCWQFIY